MLREDLVVTAHVDGLGDEFVAGMVSGSATVEALPHAALLAVNASLSSYSVEANRGIFEGSQIKGGFVGTSFCTCLCARTPTGYVPSEGPFCYLGVGGNATSFIGTTPSSTGATDCASHRAPAATGKELWTNDKCVPLSHFASSAPTTGVYTAFSTKTQFSAWLTNAMQNNPAKTVVTLLIDTVQGSLLDATHTITDCYAITK